MIAQIYVGGLAATVDEKPLRKLLNGISGIGSIEIVRELVTGKSAGYGIVQVPEVELEAAIGRLDGTSIHGSVIDARSMHVTLPGEMPVREYLLTHAVEVLSHAGVKRGHSVLDYGCGPGVYSVAAGQIVGDTGQVCAMDVREKVLQRVRDKATKANVRNIRTVLQTADSIKIPFHDAGFDAVLIYDVMHDIEDKAGLLQEVGRVLKPDGFLTAFPMHWGNEPFLKLMRQLKLFRLRDAFIPPHSVSPSHVLNFVRQ
jgi:SAM-dependent methyltransferase